MVLFFISEIVSVQHFWYLIVHRNIWYTKRDIDRGHVWATYSMSTKQNIGQARRAACGNRSNCFPIPSLGFSPQSDVYYPICEYWSQSRSCHVGCFTTDNWKLLTNQTPHLTHQERTDSWCVGTWPSGHRFWNADYNKKVHNST